VEQWEQREQFKALIRGMRSIDIYIYNPFNPVQIALIMR